jgi:hypothetical protein
MYVTDPPFFIIKNPAFIAAIALAVASGERIIRAIKKQVPENEDLFIEIKNGIRIYTISRINNKKKE